MPLIEGKQIDSTTNLEVASLGVGGTTLVGANGDPRASIVGTGTGDALLHLQQPAGYLGSQAVVRLVDSGGTKWFEMLGRGASSSIGGCVAFGQIGASEQVQVSAQYTGGGSTNSRAFDGDVLRNGALSVDGYAHGASFRGRANGGSSTGTIAIGDGRAPLTFMGLIAEATQEGAGTHTGDFVGVLGFAGGDAAGALGAVTRAIGVAGEIGWTTDATGASAITTGAALVAGSPQNFAATRTIGTADGLLVENQGGVGITTAIGVDVAAQSGATTNIGVRSQSAVVVGASAPVGTELLYVNGDTRLASGLGVGVEPPAAVGHVDIGGAVAAADRLVWMDASFGAATDATVLDLTMVRTAGMASGGSIDGVRVAPTGHAGDVAGANIAAFHADTPTGGGSAPVFALVMEGGARAYDAAIDAWDTPIVFQTGVETGNGQRIELKAGGGVANGTGGPVQVSTGAGVATTANSSKAGGNCTITLGASAATGIAQADGASFDLRASNAASGVGGGAATGGGFSAYLGAGAGTGGEYGQFAVRRTADGRYCGVGFDSGGMELVFNAAPTCTIHCDKNATAGGVGNTIAVQGGVGGDGTALLAGGAGGQTQFNGATGGAGTAAQAAGVGGATLITGGAAGVALAGGGAVGGELVLAGGPASGNANGPDTTLRAGAKAGTGTDGVLSIGETDTSAINVGASGVVTAIAGRAAVGAVGMSASETLLVQHSTAETAIADIGMRLQAISTAAGAVAAGFGVELMCELEDAGGTIRNCGSWSARWANATTATLAGRMDLALRSGGANYLAAVFVYDDPGVSAPTGRLGLGGTTAPYRQLTVRTDDGAGVARTNPGIRVGSEGDAFTVCIDFRRNATTLAQMDNLSSGGVSRFRLKALGNLDLDFRDTAGTGGFTLKDGGRVDFTKSVGLPSYTVATVPSATPAGQMIYVSDDIGGAVPAFSDGTNWLRVTDRAVVS